MIFVTWNVQGRVRAVADQAAALLEEPADVVALQEIRTSSLGAWRAQLHEAGFAHVISTLDDRNPFPPSAG